MSVVKTFPGMGPFLLFLLFKETALFSFMEACGVFSLRQALIIRPISRPKCITVFQPLLGQVEHIQNYYSLQNRDSRKRECGRWSDGRLENINYPGQRCANLKGQEMGSLGHSIQSETAA